MGWGAAMALAEEWAEWCNGPDEAYDILYRHREKKSQDRPKCPLCGKRFGGKDGVRNHLNSKFHKPSKAARALAEIDALASKEASTDG